MKLLILGNGYIGASFMRMLNDTVLMRRADADYTDKSLFRLALKHYKPDAVINCAAFTGKPNIEECEKRKDEAVRANVILPAMLSQECEAKGVRLVHLSTGCLFHGSYDFTEIDTPSSEISFYSQTKLMAEKAVKGIICRLRLPFDGSWNPRCLVAKLEKYPRLVTEANSLTYVPDLVWAVERLLQDKAPDGIYHATNSGSVTNREIALLMGWKKEFIETSQLETSVVRTNCTLSNDKISHYYRMPHVMERLEGIVTARALAA